VVGSEWEAVRPDSALEGEPVWEGT
jgi:hypothetical protein